MTEYAQFVAHKLGVSLPTGISSGVSVPAGLFPHQEALVRWSLKRGRSAIFADTGLGKTRMEIAWAQGVAKHTGMPVLILAPLAVARQTAREGAALGFDVAVCREMEDVTDGINVTNYDRLHKFDTSVFGGVVLDESSVIKHHDARTFTRLTDAFRDTPFKLPATATPAPNDWTELGTHAEFLGICTRQEMLAEFFVHDGGDTSVWRLKGHAKTQFWRWVCSWGALIRKPSDLGFDDAAYDLPPLNVQLHQVETDADTGEFLFAMEALTLSDRRRARRASLMDRVAACVERVNADSRPWVVWCDLNDESAALAAGIPDSVEIRGSDTTDAKESRLEAFANGDARVLVSKPSICGWGLNWQHANNMAFVGVTDSYEAYYQAIRRCWRFGQKHPVNVHIFASEAEGAVVANLQRKEESASEMADSLSAYTRLSVMGDASSLKRQTNTYAAQNKIIIPQFLRAA